MWGRQLWVIGEHCPPACTETSHRNTSCKEQKAGKLKEGTADGRIKKIVQNKRKSSNVICKVVKYVYAYKKYLYLQH